MKKIFLNLLSAALLAAFISGCGTSLKPEHMTRRKAEALIGDVQRVTYQNGNYQMYDRDGNLTEEKIGREVNKWTYENPLRYTDRWGQAYNVEFNDSMRIEVWDSGTHERLTTDYIFDKHGRIRAMRRVDYGSGEGKRYVYSGKDFLPYQIVFSYGDHGYEMQVTQTFTYLEIDEHGNWLKCMVEEKTEEWESEFASEDDTTTKLKDETKSYELTRRITYYPPPEDPRKAASKQISMTLDPSHPRDVIFLIGGTGTVTIDWGDGSEKKVHELVPIDDKGFEMLILHGSGFGRNRAVYEIKYSYSEKSAYTININISEGTVTNFSCGSLRATGGSMKVTNLDVSRAVDLVELFCYENLLTSLDLRNNTALIKLYSNDNLLTSLDLSRNTALKTAYSQSNKLISLDISRNSALEYLYIDSNQLTSLDISACTSLRGIGIRMNQFSANSLNALFETLPRTTSFLGGNIEIRGNPGTRSCNRNIATSRGWEVHLY